jgi:hypothetical protein
MGPVAQRVPSAHSGHCWPASSPQLPGPAPGVQPRQLEPQAISSMQQHGHCRSRTGKGRLLAGQGMQHNTTSTSRHSTQCTMHLQSAAGLAHRVCCPYVELHRLQLTPRYRHRVQRRNNNDDNNVRIDQVRKDSRSKAKHGQRQCSSSLSTITWLVDVK